MLYNLYKFEFRINSESAFQMQLFKKKHQRLLNYLKVITLIICCSVYYRYIGLGLPLRPYYRDILNSVTLPKQTPISKQVTNVADFTYNQTNTSMQNSFNSITLTNVNDLKLYNYQTKAISLSSSSFLTRNPENINYDNAFSGKSYQIPDKIFNNQNLISCNVYDNLQAYKDYNDLKNQQVSEKITHIDPGIFKIYDQRLYKLRKLHEIKSYTNLNYDKNHIISDKNSQRFWFKHQDISNSIAKNYSYPYHVLDKQQTISYQPVHNVSPFATNKYIPENETVFHQECGNEAVTYHELFNYFAKYHNIVPSVNNTKLVQYNRTVARQTFYNMHLHQVMSNKDFNLKERIYTSQQNYAIPPQPLVKSNWYMGSQFLFDSYVLRPVKSLSNKCLVGTYFGVYVNGDNVKAIDGKPILETKVGGQLYDSNLNPYSDPLHSYEAYVLAFLDTKASIKTDASGRQYVPIKLGCNSAMPLSKSLSKYIQPRYKYITPPDDGEEHDEQDYHYKLDKQHEKVVKKLSQQTCYIPLSNIKQIAGKPVK